MTASKEIMVHNQHHVMHITLNRPAKKNALTTHMYDELRLALENANNDDTVKVILISGTEGIFSAGNDLNDFSNSTVQGLTSATQLLNTIHLIDKPIVASVSGIAVGVGATLLLHCDLVYASETRFRMPFIDLGVCPEAGSSLLLPMLAGHRKAAEILMLGEFFTTETAIEIGLVTQAVPEAQVHNLAIEKAEKLAKKPTQALKTTKLLMKKAQRKMITEHMQEEIIHFKELLNSTESQTIINTLLAN